MADPMNCDVLLAGGGLANSLIALALKRAHPTLRVVMLEREAAAADSHTWCVFQPDLSPTSWALLEPLFAHIWPGYEVAFPRHRRTLTTTYACLTGPRLAAGVAAELGPDLVRGADVVALDGAGARCADGRSFAAPLVIDGRGPVRSPHLRLGFQKFVGVELRLSRPHGVTRPLVMDSTVPQADGYRFVYVLPFGPDRLLVEDTRYSDHAGLDDNALAEEAYAYARGQGWQIANEIRRERGVLPVLLGGDIGAYWRDLPAGLPTVGLRGAFFHPTTGYSLPDAARVAELIAHDGPRDSATLAALLQTRARDLWAARSIYRTVNRMMFLAAEPDQRYRVLQRFYRLSQPLIERFYADRLTWADKARVLTGWPPVPFGRAIAALPEAAAMRSGA